MLKLLFLSIIQSILLSGVQVFLKLALAKMGHITWTREFWIENLTNWWFLATGGCFVLGSTLWMYILKIYPLSMAYPLISFSYVFGMFAAILVFNESVSATRWTGVFLIIVGCFFVAK